MKLRTTFTIPPSPEKITYHTPVFFLGSCFATSIGKLMELGCLPVMINPFGTVFNPVSVCNTLSAVIQRKRFNSGDLYKTGEKWISFSHYTEFTSGNADSLLKRINDNIEQAHDFLSGSKFLFVTFGTAWVYSFNKTGEIVSNCHKIPQSEFSRRMVSLNEITDIWSAQLEVINSSFPDLKVIFTISPVRHWKEGAHGNQISKSVLLLAVEELQRHPSKPGYFPAYELVMDDLRDYRFYDTDMLHLSDTATEYIWNEFAKCYIDGNALNIYSEVLKISKAALHRLRPDSSHPEKFAEEMIERINNVQAKYPFLDLDAQRQYFADLLK